MPSGYLSNFFDQTIAFRFDPDWQSVRNLLEVQGMNAQEIVLFGCDHAGSNEMSLWLALPEGNIVNCVMSEDPATQQYASITEWQTVAPENHLEFLLAQHVASDAKSAQAFGKAVEAYYLFCQSVPPIQAAAD